MPKSSEAVRHDFSFYLLKWALIVFILILALGLMTKPIRKAWSFNYVEKGDEYLGQKKYGSAVLEYKKALFLFWGNKEALERTRLSNEASVDVMKLEDFYKFKNIQSQLVLLEQIKTLPKNEVTALKQTKEMIEKGEFQYAVIAGKNSTEMDRNYRDAWLYLGVANIDCAEMLELKDDVRQNYKNQAAEALRRASGIDPEYQPTKDYIAKLGKIK
jgi:hypothetical protein